MKTSFPSHFRHRRLLRGLSAGILGLAGAGMMRAQDIPPAPPSEEPVAAAPAPDLLSGYPESRYEKIRTRSPFEFELSKPKAEDAVDPFQDLVLAGYAGSSTRVTVYLVNTKTQERLTVAGGSESEDSFKVISVNRGTTLRTTTATLEKDGVTKKLSFDPAALDSMSGGNGAAPAPVRPGQPGQPGQPGRPVILPAGGVRPAMQAYQAPQAFIPGQANAAAQQAPPNGNPTVNAGGANVQAMLNNNAQVAPGQVQGQVQVPGIPQQGGRGRREQSTGEPRRRVVLPSQR